MTHLETGTFLPSWSASSIIPGATRRPSETEREKETSKAGRARPERHGGRSSIVPPQQWRAITAETVISRGLPGTVPASLWAIRVDCVAERAQTKHIRGVRRHTWGLSDGKRGKKRKRKSILPRRYIGRWRLRQSVVCFPRTWLLCVCVCVQVRRNVKCVSPPCVFFFEVRRVSRPSITLRARHRFFSPRRFFCKPEQQHVDQNPRVSFMKSQCDIF